MRTPNIPIPLLRSSLVAWLIVGLAHAAALAQTAAPAASAPSRAALSVNVITAQPQTWPQQLPATGTISAWQEAVISAEGAGGRLTDVLVQVGDKVKKGQLLARLATDTVQADLAQSRANLAEAQAVLAEARANAQRARELQPGGLISTQQAQQSYTAEQTAQARLAAVQARIQSDELRLAQTRIVAPDDGVISARSAVIGSFAGTGQELMRLIRRERLEWRAEVPAAELARLAPGARASLTLPSGDTLNGTLRQVAPTVDAANRMGLVYVDLPPGSAARAGMFARGQFEFGTTPALTLPQSAVVLRDGFPLVLRVGDDGRVNAIKVRVGRRVGDRIEILAGVTPTMRLVASGGAFLSEGDKVNVVPSAASGARR
jgi:HlyD family secretion protein